MTEHLASRQSEAYNSQLTSQSKFNVETCYINPQSGIKITRYLDNAYALNHQSIHQIHFLIVIAQRLKALHLSDIPFKNEFNVFTFFDKYHRLLIHPEKFYQVHPKIEELLHFYHKIKDYFSHLPHPLCPCHNDLVPENILVRESDIYFIDWEYSGMNDPLFDVGAFLLEAKLTPAEEKLFLRTYFQKEEFEREYDHILLYQFTQGILWTLWTLIKAENNEHFAGYGEKRIEEAFLLMSKIKLLGIL